MNQKRFLTAGEVFQLFGVDTDALNKLVESGQVQALADLGTFKYRSEDFAKLVQAGKLTARTAGEMFQVDDKGDMPFLKLKQDDHGLKFDEDVLFLELDEEALNEQAASKKPASKTPVVPQKWFEDSDDSVSTERPNATSNEMSAVDPNAKSSGEITDFDLNINRPKRAIDESDSDIRLVADDARMDFDQTNLKRTGSDSDVRLVDPASWRQSPQATNPGSDSDVRLVTESPEPPKSDSDVVLVPDVKASSAVPRTVPTPTASEGIPTTKKPESDSDVQLASPATSAAPPKPTPPVDLEASDSDVILIGLPDDRHQAASTQSSAKKKDSDSDVRLSLPAVEPSASQTSNLAEDFAAILAKAPDSDINLSDSPIRLGAAQEFTAEPASLAAAPVSSEPAMEDESEDIQLESSDPGISLESVGVEEVAESASPTADLEKEELDDFEIEEEDSGITLESAEDDEVAPIESPRGESDIVLHVSPNDSDITLVEPSSGSGILVDNESLDSGISIEQSESESEFLRGGAGTDSDIAMNLLNADSSISIDETSDDSGITLEQSEFEGGLALHTPASDSDIAIEGLDPDSGISLETESEDSSISLEQSEVDSGIALSSLPDDSDIALAALVNDSKIEGLDPDSGISLDSSMADSGISLAETDEDSGIGLEAKKDSDITFDHLQEDSSIRFGLADDDSGISLEDETSDSGIMLEATDSGIRLDAVADSGIALEDDSDDANATFVDTDAVQFASASHDGSQTTTMDLSDPEMRDSAFDVSLEDSDNTMEMHFDDDDFSSDTAATVVDRGKSKKSSGDKALHLSEAFQLDEALEVEDLDISEDLDAAAISDFDDEFAEAGEEVLDASDEDFGVEAVSLAESVEDEDVSEGDVAAPVAKRRATPLEPAWGLAAVAPIACASLVMAVTITVLWGGIATMWTGGEAPGPAGMLISTLAGLL